MEVHSIMMLVLTSYRHMNGVSSQRAKRFRVASFVCIFPLRLQILRDQEGLQNVTDTVGMHLYGGVYCPLRGSSKIHLPQSLSVLLDLLRVEVLHLKQGSFF